MTRSRRRMRKPCNPDHYDDPMGLDDPAPPPPVEITATVTGLSEEEDAARHIALRFNTNLRTCVNCEQVYESIFFCPRCEFKTMPLGSAPWRKKVV